MAKKQPETSIIACKRCGIRTRHRRERWIQRPLPLLLFGRIKVYEGWTCTKCGKRRTTRARYRLEEEI